VISITPVDELPEIEEGDDLGGLIAARAALEDGDVVVVAQKAVSKSEGRVVSLDDVAASEEARGLAAEWCDPRETEMILREATRIVRSRNSLVIAETRHGFVCASAGVDHSNAPAGSLVLLPLDPDASARRIRASIRAATGKDVGVVVTDSFGRPFRRGTTDVAIGTAGVAPLADLRGTRDRAGSLLRSTQVAVADEIAAAANLVRADKAGGMPVVVVRGVAHARGEGTAAELVMPAERDLFK